MLLRTCLPGRLGAGQHHLGHQVGHLDRVRLRALGDGLALDEVMSMVSTTPEVQRIGDVRRGGEDLSGLEVEPSRRAAQVEGALVKTDLLPGGVLQRLRQVLPRCRQPWVLPRASPLLGGPLLHDLLGEVQEEGPLSFDLREVDPP